VANASIKWQRCATDRLEKRKGATLRINLLSSASIRENLRKSAFKIFFASP
jgi:hypothetical protein